MKLTLLTILIGLAAGLLGALCGVGGGILMVPAFVGLLGHHHKQAVATSLAVIIITAIAATANNARTPGMMRSLSNPVLTRIFGCLLLAFGARMLWKG